LRQEAARQEAARAAAQQQEAERRASAQKQAADSAANRAGEAARASSDAPAAAGGAARSPSATAGADRPGDRPALSPPGGSASPKAADKAIVATPAQRPAAAAPERARRRTLIGRTDADIVAMMYAEKWRQKVEVNAAFDQLKQAKTGPYENPVVTVALRSDGSVESVTINRSSGLPDVDNAVRRIVMLLSPYDPFPGDLAMDVDVLEIRRVWSMDTALRLFSGGR
jgi:membrane protein involved in colicin uptake